MDAYRPEIIWIEKGLESHPRVRRILSRCPDVPFESVTDIPALIHEASLRDNALTRGKKELLLTRHKGRFLKLCPAAEASHVCCNYQVIHLGSNCPLECSYCFLQSYLTNPLMSVVVNLEDLFDELDDLFSKNPKTYFRVGTGEIIDSLALEPLLGYAAELVEYFAQKPNAFLELKTKTTHIDGLLKLDPKGSTAIAWSVNAPKICQNEEHKTASLKDRLDAAKRAAEAGYRVAFHFDPMVWHENFEVGYRETVTMIFDTILEKDIAWISAGSFRHHPSLKAEVEARFTNSRILYEEFILAPDGKMRYLKDMRLALYRTVAKAVRERSSETPFYLCTERADIWRSVFNDSHPENTTQLSGLLDRSACSSTNFPTSNVA